ALRALAPALGGGPAQAGGDQLRPGARAVGGGGARPFPRAGPGGLEHLPQARRRRGGQAPHRLARLRRRLGFQEVGSPLTRKRAAKRARATRARWAVIIAPKPTCSPQGSSRRGTPDHGPEEAVPDDRARRSEGGAPRRARRRDRRLQGGGGGAEGGGGGG